MILNGRKKETFTGKKIDIKKQNRKRLEYIGKVVLLSAFFTLQGGMPIVHAAEVPNNIQIIKSERYEYQDLYEVKGDITIYDEDGKAITIEDGEVVLGIDETYEEDDKEYRKILYENEEGEHYAAIEEKKLEKSNLFETLKFKIKETVENLTKPIKNTIENLLPNSKEEKSNVKEDKHGESEKSVDITKAIEEEIKNRRYVSVPREQGQYLHMREEPLYNSRIVDNIPNGSGITVFPYEEPIMDGNLRYIKIQYGDKIGYVSDAYLYTLQEFQELYPQKVVDVPKGEGTSLHMREKPTYGSKIVENIPQGKKVYILREEKIKDGNLEYIQVQYDGKVGYVAEQYLKDEKSTQVENENIIQNSEGAIKLNNGGAITFSDGRDLTPEKIISLIEKGTAYEGDNEAYIPEELRGNLQIIGIKMGATTYGDSYNVINRYNYNDEMYKTANKEYPNLCRGQVESLIECEKRNQPYIMYYFSQGKNGSEGIEEGEIIIQNIKDLREILNSQGLEMNNCLFYAVDIENDAGYRNSVGIHQYEDGTKEEVTVDSLTDATIEILRKLQEAGFPTVLYTDARHIANIEDANGKMIDIERIAREVPNLKLWLTAAHYRETSSTQIKEVEELIQEINKKCGTNVEYLGTQSVVTGPGETADKTELDYSSMTIEMYQLLLKEMREREGIIEGKKESKPEKIASENKQDDEIEL